MLKGFDWSNSNMLKKYMLLSPEVFFFVGHLTGKQVNEANHKNWLLMCMSY